jgi:hypothetical protein
MEAEGPRVVATDKGPTLIAGGIPFYAPDDPVGSAVRRAAAVPLEPRTLVYVPSVGLGHGLAELLARLPPECAVLCVEVDQRVMALASSHGLPADARLRVVRTADELGVVAAFQALGPGRFRRVREAALSGGWRTAPERYRTFRAALELTLRTWWRNRMTLVMLGGRLVRNLLDNLPLLAAAGDAADLATDLPVVVAGAGPSLDAALPALRALRGRYALVAADTALPTLALAGVTPDLVVCLEAQQANLRDFLPARPAGVRLVCELAGHPGAARLFSGRLSLFSTAFAPLALLDRLEAAGLAPLRVPGLGSVGVAAAWASLRLTGSGVFLAGLDFSYPNGATHARGTPAHLDSIAGGCRLSPVGHAAAAVLAGRSLRRQPSAGSAVVRTDAVLQSYRDLLETVIRDDGASRPSSRILAVGSAGLPCGAPVVDPGDLGGLLPPRAPAAAPGVHERRLRRRDPSAVRAFLDAEVRLLDEASVMLKDLASSARPATESERRLAEAVNHAWLQFPDEPDLGSRSFLARAAVALASCRERLLRASAALA